MIGLAVNVEATPMSYSYQGSYSDARTYQLIGPIEFQFQFDAEKLRNIPDGGGTISNAFKLVSSSNSSFFGNPGESGLFSAAAGTGWDGFFFDINKVGVIDPEGSKNDLEQIGHGFIVYISDDEGHLKYTGSAKLIEIEPIPEPATMLLFGIGIAGLAGDRLRRRNRA